MVAVFEMEDMMTSVLAVFVLGLVTSVLEMMKVVVKMQEHYTIPYQELQRS